MTCCPLLTKHPDKAGLGVLLLLPAAALLVGCHLVSSGPRYPVLLVSGMPGNVCMQADYGGEDLTLWKVSIETFRSDGWESALLEEYDSRSSAIVRAGECVPLDQHEIAKKLQPGFIYSAWVQNRSGPSRIFTADFCLVPGKPVYQIHQVRPKKKTGNRDWSPCNLKVPHPSRSAGS